MKTFAIVVCLVALALCVDGRGTHNGTHVDDDDWQAFKGRHSKQYHTETHEKKSYQNFLVNKKFFDDHRVKFQSGKASFQVDLNQFSDIHPDDFVASRCGYNKTTRPRLMQVAKAAVVATTKKATTTTKATTTKPKTTTTTPKTTTTKPKTTTTKPKTTTTTPKTTTTTPKTTTTTPKPTTTTPKTTTTTPTTTAPKTTTPSTIGASLNWTAQGYVTPVKNQGQCGSCWAFSSTGAIEGQHFKKSGVLLSLSEQNLVDCSTQNFGCNGGAMQYAFNYVQSNNGIATEANYPYTATNGTCKYQASLASGVTVQGYVSVAATESALQQAVATVGPISVAFDAGHQSFQLYKSGIYTEPACSAANINHAVLLVGYGTANGTDYWLLKNSWGTSWGMKGYFMMARNQNNMCGIASDACYPVVPN